MARAICYGEGYLLWIGLSAMTRAICYDEGYLQWRGLSISLFFLFKETAQGLSNLKFVYT